MKKLLGLLLVLIITATFFAAVTLIVRAIYRAIMRTIGSVRTPNDPLKNRTPLSEPQTIKSDVLAGMKLISRSIAHLFDLPVKKKLSRQQPLQHTTSVFDKKNQRTIKDIITDMQACFVYCCYVTGMVVYGLMMIVAEFWTVLLLRFPQVDAHITPAITQLTPFYDNSFFNLNPIVVPLAVILMVSLLYRTIGKPQLIIEREEKATPAHVAIEDKITSLNDKEKTLRNLERRMRLNNNDSLQKVWQALALIQQHRAMYEVALWRVDLQLWLAHLSPITQAWHSIHSEQTCARYQRLITNTQHQGERMLAQWQTQRASVIEGQTAADAPLLCNTPQAKQHMMPSQK